MTTPGWHERSKRVHIDGRAVIEGRRVDAASGARFDNISPIDGRILGAVARCDAADVDAAVASARSRTAAGLVKPRPSASAR